MRPAACSPHRSVVIALVQRRVGDPRALRAVLAAARLLGLACGVRLARLGPHDARATTIGELQLALARAQTDCALLTERLARIAPKHRPHYTPAERYRILELVQFHGLTLDEAARRFLITPTTIGRWSREAHAAHQTVGTLVRPQPPVRRFADAVRHFVQLMDRAGIGGNALIARTLLRAGWRMSAETVRRIRREPRVLPPPRPRAAGTIIARRPNHVWLIDLTTIPGLFRIFTFTVAVILDAWSRRPLATRVFRREPSAVQIWRLVQHTITRHGPPGHVVTDRGAQFTSARFRARLRARGIRQRFGAVGRVGSIALIERFWRTLKAVARTRDRPPLRRRALEERLGLAMLWYACVRPHSALGGATPAERYGLVPPPVPTPRAPPRGRPSEGPHVAPFTVVFLDPDRTLPVLVRRAA